MKKKLLLLLLSLCFIFVGCGDSSETEVTVTLSDGNPYSEYKTDEKSGMCNTKLDFQKTDNVQCIYITSKDGTNIKLLCDSEDEDVTNYEMLSESGLRGYTIVEPIPYKTELKIQTDGEWNAEIFNLPKGDMPKAGNGRYVTPIFEASGRIHITSSADIDITVYDGTTGLPTINSFTSIGSGATEGYIDAPKGPVFLNIKTKGTWKLSFE